MIIDKEFLKKHSEHRKELRDEQQRYEMINGINYYGKSPSNIDGMPHCPSTGNAIENSIVKKNDAETYIDKMQALVNTEECQIEEVLSKLTKANQKYIIRLRYFQCFDWDEITYIVYGDKKGYFGSQDKYKAKCMKVHGLALQNMIRIQRDEQAHK